MLLGAALYLSKDGGNSPKVIHSMIFMIFISMLHQHYVRVSSYITRLWNRSELQLSAVGTDAQRLFLKKNSAPNSINTILTYALNNFEIGKVELVLNKLLIYLMALFNNA